MKLTGIIVALVGIVILAYAGFMQLQGDRTVQGTLAVEQSGQTWQLVLGAGAIIVGGLMATLGGRGYFESRDLAVRN